MTDVAAAILIAVFIMLWWPELVFVLFLNAGVFKGSPEMVQLQQWLGIDATLALELLSALSILAGFIRGRLKASLPGRNSVVPFFLFVFLAAASLLYTTGPLYGREKLVRLCVITAYAFWAPVVAFGAERSLKRLFIAWAIFSLVVVLLSLNPSWGAPVLFRQAFGNTSGYLMVSSGSSQTALLCLILAGADGAGWVTRAALIMVAIACAAGSLLTGSRAGPLAMLVTFIMLALTLGWRAFRRAGTNRLRLGHLAALVILSGSTIWLVSGQRAMFSGFLERSNLAYTESRAYEGQRIEMATIATRLMLTLPVGAGLGGFTYHYLGWDDTRGGFAHNIFLEIGSELGPVGLAAFLALCWSALGPYIRLRGKGRDIPVIGLALVFLFIYMLVLYQFHGDLNDARVMWAWAGALFAFHRHLPAAALSPAAAKRRPLYRAPILSEAGSQ